MRPAFWHDRRAGDNVVRVRHFHNAPQRVQARPTEPAQIFILPVVRVERDPDELLVERWLKSHKRRRNLPSVFGPFNDGGMHAYPFSSHEPKGD